MRMLFFPSFRISRRPVQSFRQGESSLILQLVFIGTLSLSGLESGSLPLVMFFFPLPGLLESPLPKGRPREEVPWHPLARTFYGLFSSRFLFFGPLAPFSPRGSPSK